MHQQRLEGAKTTTDPFSKGAANRKSKGQLLQRVALPVRVTQPCRSRATKQHRHPARAACPSRRGSLGDTGTRGCPGGLPPSPEPGGGASGHAKLRSQRGGRSPGHQAGSPRPGTARHGPGCTRRQGGGAGHRAGQRRERAGTAAPARRHRAAAPALPGPIAPLLRDPGGRAARRPHPDPH